MNYPIRIGLLLIAVIPMLAISACAGSQDNEFELVPLVEETPTSLPTAWAVVAEIAYTDEFGTSNYSLTGEFSVDSDGTISGSGKGLILHSRPCYVLSDPYDFPIQGY